MKYTIMGFSQETVQEINSKMPDKKSQINLVDLTILRYILDFWPNTIKVTEDNIQYAWIAYSKILSDLPILNIDKRALARRIDKICDVGLLERYLVDQNRTCFRPGKLVKLIDINPLYQRVFKSTEPVAKISEVNYQMFLQEVLDNSELNIELEFSKLTYKDFLKSLYWKCISKYMREQQPCCERCGATKKLKVHHTTYKNHFKEHLLDVMKNDLEVLCEDCHKAEHDLED